MDLNDVLKLDIKNLANEQYKALKQHTISKLEEIILLLKEDKLQDVFNRLKFSPDGDGWGSENYFINFSYNETEKMDLENILSKMAELKNIKIDKESDK